MALRATIYKADLNVADTDRHYYGTHGLTVARHPSETDERMMVRLVAFALHASEELAFTKGLSDTDEPDLWEKDLTGAVKLWIEVGQPEERRILRACARRAGHRLLLWRLGQQDLVGRRAQQAGTRPQPEDRQPAVRTEPRAGAAGRAHDAGQRQYL